MLDSILLTVGKMSDPGRRMTARAVVSQQSTDAFRGEVELELEPSAGGHLSRQSVEGVSCRSVADALALMVAFAVNPDAVKPDADPVKSAGQSSSTDAGMATAPRVPLGLTAGASFLIDTLMLPSTASLGA
jgi:hypothetical protein